MIDLDLAENMRRDGATYKEIAAQFGVSRQAVHSSMQNRNRIRRRYEAIFDSCPYEGFKRYFAENKRVKITEICTAVFGNSGEKLRAKTRRLIDGDNVLLTVENIKRLEKLTGMSFDELFRVEAET